MSESSAPAAGNEDPWQLCLYVAGRTHAARTAVDNARALCEAHLAGRYTLDVIDLRQRPAEAERAQILAVPTLVRTHPKPERRVVGDLSNTSRALTGLGLPVRKHSVAP